MTPQSVCMKWHEKPHEEGICMKWHEKPHEEGIDEIIHRKFAGTVSARMLVADGGAVVGGGLQDLG